MSQPAQQQMVVDSAYVKISFIGTQTKPVPTLFFHLDNHAFSRGEFQALCRGYHEHPNDSLPISPYFQSIGPNSRVCSMSYDLWAKIIPRQRARYFQLPWPIAPRRISPATNE